LMAEPQTVQAVLLVPPDSDPRGLLTGPYGAFPPTVRAWFCAKHRAWIWVRVAPSRSPDRSTPEEQMIAGAIHRQRSPRCVCHMVMPLRRALRLAWEGQPTLAGLDWLARAMEIYPVEAGIDMAGTVDFTRAAEDAGWGVLVLLDAQGQEIQGD
jgi:hypothetical protein